MHGLDDVQLGTPTNRTSTFDVLKLVPVIVNVNCCATVAVVGEKLLIIGPVGSTVTVTTDVVVELSPLLSVTVSEIVLLGVPKLKAQLDEFVQILVPLL